VSGYTLPDEVTLKNKFGATSEDELDRLEVEAVRRRLLEIELGAGPKGQFDAEHLKAIHQHLFQDVYEWAGRTRDERVALSDGTIATMPGMRKVEGEAFAIGPAIPLGLDNIGESLRAADYLRGLPREEFAERAADIMAELNAVHPFREGNGRTQRTFLRELAKEAGHNLDFSVVSAERMVQASVAAHERGDTSMMRRMFDEISDPERSQMLRTSITALERLKVDWNDRYVATIAPGHTVDLVLAGVADDQFMARTSDQILFGRTADLPKPHPDRGQAFTLTAPPRAQGRNEPLSANEVLARHGDPALQVRYQAQEQRREQTERTASPTPATPASAAARGNTPPEKKAEMTEAEQKRFNEITGRFTREKDGKEHERENERGGNRGGRGGRGRK
jgi:cell filamentation protein